MTLYDHIFVVIYPAYAFFSYRKVKQKLIDNKPCLLKSDYQLTSFWLWLLGISALFIWIFNSRPIEALGIDYVAENYLLLTGNKN